MSSLGGHIREFRQYIVTPYYPIFAPLSVKWLLAGGLKQSKFSNF